MWEGAWSSVSDGFPELASDDLVWLRESVEAASRSSMANAPQEYFNRGQVW